MAKIKTTVTSKSVADFINTLTDEVKRTDSFAVVEMMKNITGLEPKMWGPSIVGFGNYHYKYDSGHEGDMPTLAFSPRSTAIVFYVWDKFEEKEQLLQKLGKHKTGKVCVYVKKLADIDITVLNKLLSCSLKEVQLLYPNTSAK